MDKTFIFIPDAINIETIGLLKGFRKTIDESSCYFITSSLISDKQEEIVGLCSSQTPRGENLKEFVHINNKTLEVNVYEEEKQLKNCSCIYYDYVTFKKCNANAINGDCFNEQFKTLTKAVNEELNYKAASQNRCINILLYTLMLLLKMVNSCTMLLKYSAIVIYLRNHLSTSVWLVLNFKSRGKFSLEGSNFIVCRLLDVLLGLVTLYCFFSYEEHILNTIRKSAEFIVSALREVLNMLMGSPAGLKLNYALNRTLGIFFFYHISLWAAFIKSTSSCLQLIVYVLVVAIPFGISIQVAILSDLISFLTFHVYCIYVYAARLYHIQLYCLMSLWRLFIGRKYNPLRSRVDSFQYSHNQLFIGTLGFTVLLFLMPTTVLYYTVLTSFRAISIIIGSALTRTIVILQNLPLYVCILWILDSYKIRGAIRMVLIKGKGRGVLKIYATLKRFSLWKTIRIVLPPDEPDNSVLGWGAMFKGIFTGTLL